jgi:two-component system sensor histidine kinase ChvG
MRLKGRDRAAPAAISLPAGRRLPRQRWISPLLRRILLVNIVPLLLLVAALLYLDQYQNGLLEAEVSALREQARIFGGAIAESAVSLNNKQDPKIVPAIARPLLYRITEPTPDAEVKLYAPDGTAIADSRVRSTAKGEQRTPLPVSQPWGPFGRALGWISNKLVNLLPNEAPAQVDLSPGGAGPEWAPDVKEVLRLSSNDQTHEMPPYIRRTVENQLLVTVSEPVERDGHTVGIILLTREAREVDASLYSIRVSILSLFVLAIVLTVLMSFYLSRTIARPMLQLAIAAAEMREG